MTCVESWVGGPKRGNNPGRMGLTVLGIYRQMVCSGWLRATVSRRTIFNHREEGKACRIRSSLKEDHL